MTDPIGLEEKDSIYLDGPIISHNIKKINEAISSKKWHDNFADREDIRSKYNAVILGPFDQVCNEGIRNGIVHAFKSKGWDCFSSYAYDARGPHYNFYISKKHFD